MTVEPRLDKGKAAIIRPDERYEALPGAVLLTPFEQQARVMRSLVGNPAMSRAGPGLHLSASGGEGGALLAPPHASGHGSILPWNEQMFDRWLG